MLAGSPGGTSARRTIVLSSSPLISAPCCGVCVIHAAGQKMRLPLLSIRASQSSPSSLQIDPGWALELKHDGYRLQIHVRDGRVKLYTINGADWSKRYPRIVESRARVAPNCL